MHTRVLGCLFLAALSIGCASAVRRGEQGSYHEREVPEASTHASPPEPLRESAKYLGITLDRELAERGSGDARFGVFERMSGAVRGRQHGGLTVGFIFQASKPISVWRVYGGDAYPLGQWWVLEKPRGGRAVFRATYAMCAEWANSMKAVVRCEVLPGTVFVAGATEGAECSSGSSYDSSDAWQVFLPADWKTLSVSRGDTDATYADSLRCEEAYEIDEAFSRGRSLAPPSISPKVRVP